MVDTLLVVAQYRVRIPASVTSSGVAQSDIGFVMFPAKIRFFYSAVNKARHPKGDSLGLRNRCGESTSLETQ